MGGPLPLPARRAPRWRRGAAAPFVAHHRPPEGRVPRGDARPWRSSAAAGPTTATS